MSKTNSTKKLNRAFMLMIIVACILVIPSILQLSTQLSYRSAIIGEVQKHQALWKLQNISKYKLGLRTYSYLGEEESGEYVIEHGQGRNCVYCAHQSIEHLFDRILQTDISTDCGTDGCACNGPLIVKVVYDTKYNFPKRADAIFDHDARDLFRAWPFERPVCLMINDLGLYYGWEIYSFTPID